MTSPSHHSQGSIGPSVGLEKMIVKQEGVTCGKKHESVTGPSIPPFIQMLCIGSPVHLKIGGANKVLEKICDEITDESGANDAESPAEKLEKPWKAGGLAP